MSRLWLTALCLVMCMGCEKSAPSADAPKTKDAAPKASQTDPQITSALDMLGDGAPVVGVIDGRSWPKVHQRLKPLAKHLPPPIRGQFDTLKDLPGLLNGLARAALGQGLELQGLDAKRPAVFALNEAVRSGPPGITMATIDFQRAQPLRHELILPATDAAALEASLRAVLGKVGKTHDKGYDLGELQIDLKAEGKWVRVAALMPADPKNVERMWRPPAKAPTRTPAFHRLASPGAGAAVLARPWRFRVAYGQHGSNQILAALATGVSPDMRASLFAHGLSIVLNGARLMHAARPEFDDSVARLVGDDAGVHLEGIHTLSKTAQPAFKRAVEKGGRLFGLKNTKPLAYVRQSIDLRGLLDGVGPRPIFSRIKKMRNFSQAWMECGSGCVFHTALRVPLSTMRGLLDLAPTEVKTALWTLPTSAQLAVLDVNPKAPVLALAADVPARFDTSLLRKADMLEVHLIPKGERAALLIGLQVDPRTVFDVERTETIETVGDMTVDLAALGPRIPGLPPAAFAVLSGMGPLTGETQVVDATLGWRLHLSTSPGVKRAPFEVTPQPDFASPIWGFEPGKGDTCLLEATTGVGQLFDALAQVMAANRAQFVAKGLEELKPSLDCAAADPQTQPAVAGFYRLFAHIMTMQAESGDPVSVIPVLKSICDTTKDPWICAQPERLAALPTAAVPAVKSHVDFAPRYPPATPILVTAKGVFHQNKPADLKTLAKGMDPASIAVDKTLTFAAAVPVLRALSGLKLQVQVQTEGGRRSVPLGDAYRAVKPMQPPSPGLAQPPGVLDMANLSKGGVLDVAKLPKGGVLQALKDTPATDVLDDARWHVAVAPGKATVRRRLTGAIVFDGAVGDGSALEAAFDHKAALVQIDPATPWPQALQVLAVLGPKARLTETPPPKERAPVLDAPVDTRDKAVLQRVIRRNQRQVRYCYEKQLMKNPALAGKLHAAFEIQMDGSVSKVEIEASEPLKPVGECIARRIKRWQFPTATTVTKVRYPFIFKSN